MIDLIKRNRIISSIEKHVKNNKQKFNLLKMGNDDKLKEIRGILKKEKFKGWFTSIDDGNNVEVALFNNKNLFEYIGTRKYKNNINQLNWNSKKIQIQTWGKRFKICDKPIKLNINIRYKSMIEKFRYFEQKSKYISVTTFQLLLKTAKIKYHNNQGKIIKKEDYDKYVNNNQ